MQPDQNQYNFIMDSQGASSGPALLQDPKKRNIIAVLFVVIILFFVVIAVAIFASLGKGNTSTMVDVVAYQAELLRISDLGLKGATDPTVRAKASTLQSFIQSDLAKSSSYLASTGKELEKTDYTIHLDTSVDKSLENAALRNAFEEELLKIFDATTSAYKISLQKALDSASSEKEREVIKSAGTNILTFEGPQENSGVSPAVAVTKL
jgi:hypothetical protein